MLGSAIKQGNMAVGEDAVCQWDCTSALRSIDNRAVMAGEVTLKTSWELFCCCLVLNH